jgi:hypothetical protein
MLAAVVLTTCVGLVIAGGVVLRAQPGDSLPTPAVPNGAAKGQPNVPPQGTDRTVSQEGKGTPEGADRYLEGGGGPELPTGQRRACRDWRSFGSKDVPAQGGTGCRWKESDRITLYKKSWTR